MIAAGAWLETSEPNPALMKMSRLTIPMLIVTGRNSSSTLPDPRVAPVEHEREPELDRAQCEADHQHLHDRRDQPRDRVCVDLVLAVELRVQDDEQHQDHDVPHRGCERRNRELVVGLEDPHEQPGQAQQQHDREQNLRQSRGQVRGNVRAREQRHHEIGDRHPHQRQRPEREQDDPEQRRGDPERLALAALLEQLREHRHERRRQRRLREQVAEQVRNLGGERERGGRRRGGEERRLGDLTSQPRDPRQRRREREDRRVDREPAAR